MGKSKLFLVFALIALQGTFLVSSVAPRGDLEEILQEFLELTKEVDSTINFINENFAAPLRDYDIKIGSTVSKHNFSTLLEQLEETVKKIESGIADDPGNCVDKAWRMVMITSTELKNEVGKIVSEAKIKVEKVIGVVQNLSKKAGNLKARLQIDLWECMDDNNLQCLKDLLENFRQEHEDLKAEIEKEEDGILQLTERGIELLESYLKQLDEDLVLKSETIIWALNQCIQLNLVPVVASRSVLDMIKQIKEKLNKIMDVISSLPISIDQIPDKIQQAISKLNIAIIADKLKERIDEAISDGGRNAENCRLEAETRLRVLVNNSEKTVKLCLDSANNRIGTIVDDFSSLYNEAKELLTEFNADVLSCNLANILNPVGLAKCFKGLYDEYMWKISSLQTKVEDFSHSIPEQNNDILKQVVECTNKVQIETVKKGQNLIEDVEHCVLTSGSLFN